MCYIIIPSFNKALYLVSCILYPVCTPQVANAIIMQNMIKTHQPEHVYF